MTKMEIQQKDTIKMQQQSQLSTFTGKESFYLSIFKVILKDFERRKSCGFNNKKDGPNYSASIPL